MKLKSLNISRGYYNHKPLQGEVLFVSDDKTEIKMKLDEQLSIEIVHLCADAIARAGQETAKALTAEALQVTAIEHQSK